jgi:hypothetical protein
MTKPDDDRQGIDSPDSVTVLTRSGNVVRLPGPVRVSLLRPCVIDSKGVALYRWPWRSKLIPHESVDRFDVAVFGGDPTPVRLHDAGAELRFKRLALRTRDGRVLSVWGPVSDFLSRGGHGPPIDGRATHLNNQLPR